MIHAIIEMKQRNPRFGCLRIAQQIAYTFGIAINQVVSKRMVKKQEMQWSERGAQRLLQVRTHVLNDELEAVFRH